MVPGSCSLASSFIIDRCGTPCFRFNRRPAAGSPGPPRVSSGAMASVALLTPFAAPSVRGNAVTVGRIARGLRQRGLDVRVWDLSVSPPATIEAEVQGYRPAPRPASPARQAGPLALDLAGRLGVPLVVTLTGTDAN